MNTENEIRKPALKIVDLQSFNSYRYGKKTNK